MRTPLKLRIVASVFLGAAILAFTIERASSPITVGTEVLVSVNDPTSAYSEYTADIDPEHPERLMACTQPHSPSFNERKNTLHTSFDGGKTWSLALEDLPVRGGLIAGDPVCAYTFNNVALLSTLFQHEEEGFGKGSGTWDAWPTGIGQRIYRSTDGGKTWGKPYEIGFMDNQNILVDRSGGKYNGRIYINGNVSGDPFWLIYSTDSGKSFQRGEIRHVEGRFQQFDRGTVLLNGTVVLPFVGYDKRNPDNPTAAETYTYVVSSSTDGGVHMSKPDTVARNRATCGFGAALPQMATDYSHGPFRGRVYFMWGEVEGSGSASGLASRCVQVISYSDDSAKTWSAPVQVSDLPYRGSSQKGPDTRVPALAINKDGVVAATWYDRREDPKNRSTKLRFSASLDGGETWLPSVAVSTKPFTVDGPRGLSVLASVSGGGHKARGGTPAQPATDVIQTPLRAGARQTTGSQGGDYSILLANPNGTFHAFWVDNRGQVTKPTQLFTTTVNVAGTVSKYGSPELAALENVTRKLEVQYRSSNSWWDGDYLNVDLGVVLLNVSKDTIVGPLKYRILSSNSPIGPVILRDSRAEAAGAVLDLTNTLPAGGLSPDAITKMYEIKLRIGPVPRDIADDGYQSMGAFNAKILGKVRPGTRSVSNDAKQ